MNTLIIYSSLYGQTEKISHRIANVIRSPGHEVTLMSVDAAMHLESVLSYDQVILGSPIYAENHSREIGELIDQHRAGLANINTGFFSVSLSAAGTGKQKREATDCRDRFLEELMWRPQRREIFAGGLPYRRYNFFVRMMMKWVVWRSGGDTDSSINHEYTDWTRVETFAREFIQQPPAIERTAGNLVEAKTNQACRM